MNRLVLIDGNAIIHRAYHALPPLTNKNGEVDNAVYGFFSMFLKILEDLKPSFIIVCFDRPKPTFRQQLYVGYQAKRPKMADDLVPQIGFVHKVLEKAGVAIFEVGGYEADDLIGTLATQAVEKKDDRGLKIEDGNLKMEDRKSINLPASNLKNLPSTIHHLPSTIEVIIVSGDRDLLQLVNSRVKMLAPITGMTNMILYDDKKVEEKFGIKPAQIIDYKALVGDSSDNYPGVAGIGPKTASDLIKKYETFENIYTHLNELPAKIAEKLSTDAEQAALCKKLATIIIDAPITLDIDKCSSLKLNKEGLKEALVELGFKSLVKRLEGKDGASEMQVKKEPDHIKQLGLL